MLTALDIMLTALDINYGTCNVRKWYVSYTRTVCNTTLPPSVYTTLDYTFSKYPIVNREHVHFATCVLAMIPIRSVRLGATLH